MVFEDMRLTASKLKNGSVRIIISCPKSVKFWSCKGLAQSGLFFSRVPSDGGGHPAYICGQVLETVAFKVFITWEEKDGRSMWIRNSFSLEVIQITASPHSDLSYYYGPTLTGWKSGNCGKHMNYLLSRKCLCCREHRTWYLGSVSTIQRVFPGGKGRETTPLGCRFLNRVAQYPWGRVYSLQRTWVL